MNKPCCIGEKDACPRTSSCSMILRSACSKRSNTSSAVGVEGTVHRKRKVINKDVTGKGTSEVDSYSGLLHLDLSLESSLKQLALKSAKTISILKESLYSSLELSELGRNTIFQTDVLNVGCAKELHFSDISASSNSSYLNGSFINREECSHSSSGAESDLSRFSSISETSMSRTKRFTRSTASSLRELSASHSEEKGSSNFSSSFHSAGELGFTETGANNFKNINDGQELSAKSINSNFNSDRSNIHSRGETLFERRNYSPESSQMDVSAVQYTAFDRFRWLLWRFIYLKIIKMVNFDVWLLSRLHQYRKYAVFLLFLLPLLLFTLFVGSSVTPLGVVSSLYSTVVTYTSSAVSFLGDFFVQSEELVTEDIPLEETTSSSFFEIFTILPPLPVIISSFFSSSSNTDKSASYISEQSSHNSDSSVSLSKEDIKILVVEVLEEKFKDLLKNMQNSDAQNAAPLVNSEEEIKLQDEIKELRQDFQFHTETMNKLQKDLVLEIEKKSDSGKIETLTVDLNLNINHINTKLKELEKKFDELKMLKKTEPKLNLTEVLALLEAHINAVRKEDGSGTENKDASLHVIIDWLSTKFVRHETVSAELNSAFKKLREELQSNKAGFQEYTDKTVQSILHKYMESLKRNLTVLSETSVLNEMYSYEQVKKLIKEAIMLYDSDKTGKVDYALESGGGSVLGTRCTEAYLEKNGKFSVLGIPLWSSQSSPRTAIQPEIQPGRCWAFKGSQGFLVLELSATIYPTGFTVEHIPVSLSPTGLIDSAPKDFSVWGLYNENDSRGKLLGSYVYDANGESLQYFPVQNSDEEPFSFVELKILSNHGNLEYTCLYRFRVHGTRVR